MKVSKETHKRKKGEKENERWKTQRMDIGRNGKRKDEKEEGMVGGNLREMRKGKGAFGRE